MRSRVLFVVCSLLSACAEESTPGASPSAPATRMACEFCGSTDGEHGLQPPGRDFLDKFADILPPGTEVAPEVQRMTASLRATLCPLVFGPLPAAGEARVVRLRDERTDEKWRLQWAVLGRNPWCTSSSHSFAILICDEIEPDDRRVHVGSDRVWLIELTLELRSLELGRAARLCLGISPANGGFISRTECAKWVADVTSLSELASVDELPQVVSTTGQVRLALIDGNAITLWLDPEERAIQSLDPIREPDLGAFHYPWFAAIEADIRAGKPMPKFD